MHYSKNLIYWIRSAATLIFQSHRRDAESAEGINYFHAAEKGGMKKEYTPFQYKIGMDINELSSKIIGAAIEVHKNLGPGLLEFYPVK